MIPFLFSSILPASVSGTVTDLSGANPVEGAVVVLMDNSGQTRYESFTDENGFYQIYQIASGTYQLFVHAYGFETYSHPSALILDENSNLTIDVQLVPSSTTTYEVSGNVTDSETNLPISEATVLLGGFGYIVIVETDIDGNYTFNAVEEGLYRLSCSKELYNTFQIQNLVVDQDTVINISLTPFIYGIISGNVFKDIDGSPVEGAMISLIPSDTVRNFHFIGITDANGNYEIFASPGEYYVLMLYYGSPANQFYSEYYDDVHSLEFATVVEVLENQPTPNINFGIPEAETITITLNGTVTDEQNNPLEDAIISVYDIYFWSDSVQTTTSSDGNFSLTFSVSEIFSYYEFIVGAEKDGYLQEFYFEKSSFFEADVFSVFSDTVINNVDFTLAEDTLTYNNSISGTVTNENGEAIENCMVFGFARNSGIPPLFTVAITDVDGNYTLQELANIEFYILFSASGSGNSSVYVDEFYDNVYTWEEATPVLAVGQIQNINAILSLDSSWYPSAGAIVGLIKDENNNPISNVRITLKTQAGDVVGSAISNSTGDYSINVNNPNSYEMFVSKVGFVSQSSSFIYNPQQQATYLLNFDLAQSITGVENDVNTVIPTDVQLADNYPNPFNPSTVIKFSIPQNQNVRLTIYNLIGQKVKELFSGELQKGGYAISWDATTDSGSKVTSGIYFYSLETSDAYLVKKMILAK
jgi:hypothetical protein